MELPKKFRYNGERIYFRTLSFTDVSIEYQSWLTDPEINFFLETRGATIKELKKYIKKYNDDPDYLLFGVFDKENNIHIGNVNLAPIEWEKKTAGFGILLGKKSYWGKGIGTEMTKLTIDYAFNKLGLVQVTLGTMFKNKRPQRTFEKAGFIATGAGKRKIKKTGEYYDEVQMIVKNNETSR